MKQSLHVALFLFALSVVVFSASCQSDISLEADDEDANRPEPISELEPGFLKGYLEIRSVDYGRGAALAEWLPDSRRLVPPPPTNDSIGFQYDVERMEEYLSFQGTERHDLAISDDSLSFPGAQNVFSCSLGIRVSESDTPFLHQMLRRTLVDAALSTFPAKYEYERARPHEVNKLPTGLSEGVLENLTPAYPSAHAAIGWAWALILSGVAPDRSNAVLERGMAFGESRNVVNLHWPSDTVWGRVMASAVVSQLHANSAFRRDFEQAREEYQDALSRGLEPVIDCESETRALQLKHQDR